MDRPRSSAVLRLPRARRVGPGARLFTYRGFEAASARATPGWAASDPSTSRPGYETQFSKRWCSLSFGARTRRLGSVEGRAWRRSPPGGSRCSLHGLLRPLLLFLRLSTAGSTAACASGASPPMVASLSAAGAQALKRRRQLQLHVHAVQRARRRLLKVALRSCDALPRRTAGTAKRHELVGCSGPNAVAAKPYQMRQRRRRGR